MTDDPWSLGYDTAMEEASHEASAVQIKIDKAVEELKRAALELKLTATALVPEGSWKPIVEMMNRIAEHEESIARRLEEK